MNLSFPKKVKEKLAGNNKIVIPTLKTVVFLGSPLNQGINVQKIRLASSNVKTAKVTTLNPNQPRLGEIVNINEPMANADNTKITNMNLKMSSGNTPST